ncbi:MAG: hypothetical protein GX660_20945 [Clostridiaceae bacterium]|nr:hypothetical protein [Clostridiaceae bacterium]
MMKLSEEVKENKTINASSSVDAPIEDNNEKAGLSVYDCYIGKIIKRKESGAITGLRGIVKSIDGELVTVEVLEGEKAGYKTKIQLPFILKKNGVYEIS